MSDLHSGGTRRAVLRLAVAILIAVVVVLAAVAVYAQRNGPFAPASTPRPDTGEGVTPGPIATGQLVQPSAPGATPLVSADTMRFERPTFEFRGSDPWQIRDMPTPDHVLEGYASRPSYLPGETLRLAVSTSAPWFTGIIFRVSGSEPAARPFVRVGTIDRHTGRLQRAPVIDPVTKLVAARWEFDVEFRIPDSWPSGMYLVRLDSDQGVQSYVPFVVRSGTAHRILVVSSALNWQAYNIWGGSDAYQTSIGEPLPGVERAFGVSFDRPYAGDGGAGQLFFLELPFISWIERQGLDVAFTTDYDLSVDPAAQPMPKVIVFNGHDEYWGVRLYNWLDQHVNQVGDLDLAMLAADSGYWPVSLTHDTPDGPRDVIVLKNGPIPAALGGRALPPDGGTNPGPGSVSGGAASSGSELPSAGAEPSESPGSEDIEERGKTVVLNFGPTGPYVGSYAGQPIFGVHYRGVTTDLGRYTLDPGADPHLLAGTGLQPGGSIGFIAGGEVDGVDDAATYGGPLGGRYDHVFATAAQIPGRASYRWTAQAVWRELPSGGRVFSSGTFYWGWALDPNWGAAHAVPTGFGRLTLNILAWLGGG